jgi:hypothetical protein
MTWDRQLYFPSEGRRAEDFSALKNPTASAGFEPANLGSTSRPSTPLFVALRIQHAMRMRHIVICGLPRSAIFFHIFAKKKKVTEHKMCVLTFYKLSSESFLILIRIERDIMIEIY